MKKKILVVDNHPVFLKMMTTLLEKEGHIVLSALDGLSALAVLQNFTPDIIFLDLIMPGIGGDKLCRMIRKNPELKGIYVVIVSAVAAEEAGDRRRKRRLAVYIITRLCQPFCTLPGVCRAPGTCPA